MPVTFLTHSSVDKRFVRKLAERLTEFGVQVWLDEAQIEIGDSLIDKISTAIHEADFIAAVISKTSISSAWWKKELSLALSKEVKSDRAVVLPVIIDNTPLPLSLADKLYADFRREGDFERSAKKILRAMGIDSDRKAYRSGIAIEWTDEGPRLFGHNVVVSASEGNALLDRWHAKINGFIHQEMARGRSYTDALDAANVLAIIRACADTYNKVPDEEEMKEGKTELSRKCDLLYLFFEAISEEAKAGGDGRRAK